VQRFENALDAYEDVDFTLDARFLIRALIALGAGQSRFRYLTESCASRRLSVSS
jgi:hypothetical protein